MDSKADIEKSLTHQMLHMGIERKEIYAQMLNVSRISIKCPRVQKVRVSEAGVELYDEEGTVVAYFTHPDIRRYTCSNGRFMNHVTIFSIVDTDRYAEGDNSGMEMRHLQLDFKCARSCSLFVADLENNGYIYDP